MFDTLIKQYKVGLNTKRFYQQYDCEVVYQIILAYNHIEFVGMLEVINMFDYYIFIYLVTISLIYLVTILKLL